MSRLIDADKLKAHYAWWKGGTREMTMDEAKSDFDTIIDLQPTVEAIPVQWLEQWVNRVEAFFDSEISETYTLKRIIAEWKAYNEKSEGSENATDR